MVVRHGEPERGPQIRGGIDLGLLRGDPCGRDGVLGADVSPLRRGLLQGHFGTGTQVGQSPVVRFGHCLRQEVQAAVPCVGGIGGVEEGMDHGVVNLRMAAAGRVLAQRSEEAEPDIHVAGEEAARPFGEVGDIAPQGLQRF